MWMIDQMYMLEAYRTRELTDWSFVVNVMIYKQILKLNQLLPTYNQAQQSLKLTEQLH